MIGSVLELFHNLQFLFGVLKVAQFDSLADDGRAVTTTNQLDPTIGSIV